VTCEGKLQQDSEALLGPLGSDVTGSNILFHDLGNFDIEKVRRMERFTGREKPRFQARCSRILKQPFDGG